MKRRSVIEIEEKVQALVDSLQLELDKHIAEKDALLYELTGVRAALHIIQQQEDVENGEDLQGPGRESGEADSEVPRDGAKVHRRSRGSGGSSSDLGGGKAPGGDVPAAKALVHSS